MVPDSVIIPTTPDIDSYGGINKVADIIKEVQDNGVDVSCIGILITEYPLSPQQSWGERSKQ